MCPRNTKKDDPFRPRTFRPRVNESKDFLKFISIQSNFNDSVRYLIEKEIAENGVRDLCTVIPAVRNFKHDDILDPLSETSYDKVCKPKEPEKSDESFSHEKLPEDISENRLEDKKVIAADEVVIESKTEDEIPDCYS